MNNDTNFVSLPDDEAGTFGMFYDWVNTGELSRPDGSDLEFKDLINLYSFAKAHECPKLANKVLDMYFLRMAKE